MKGVISLTVGQPDFVTPWHIRDVAIKSLQDGETYYTSNSGLLELREEISKYLSRKFGLEYSPKNEIIVTIGGSEAIDLAVRAVINPGDEVIIPIPSFVCYGPIAQMASAAPVFVNTYEKDKFKLT
ncbi:MAG: aminotransferase class I/II-fold pyridoxal phosphate-dependent enzyme, partial [Clostridia bacterium]|nr:aminotransferase class I/II-fold pyridoxal phosphate-dependent enzyme [Clostridia bacterium]